MELTEPIFGKADGIFCADNKGTGTFYQNMVQKLTMLNCERDTCL